MRKRGRLVAGGVIVGLLAAVAAVVARHLAPRRSTLPLGTLGRGAWSWFGDPRVVSLGGRDATFVGWIGPSGEVVVGAVARCSDVRAVRVVGHSPRDDHGAPSLVVEPDGRLTAFWSGHEGHAIHYRTTVDPANISRWGPVRTVPVRRAAVHQREAAAATRMTAAATRVTAAATRVTAAATRVTRLLDHGGRRGFTYPNLVLLASERNTLYLFFRGADWSADYIRRGPDGRWGPVGELIRIPHERPYLKVDSNGRDEIAFAFTDGHPRNVLTSVYYTSYRAGRLRTASGRVIGRVPGAAIAPRRADLVYDARVTHIPAWVWDVALDHRGRPAIVYVTFPSKRPDVYWYAAWTGSAWASHRLTDGGGTISSGGTPPEHQYSGGIALDHSDPSTLYLSRQVQRGFEIERWTTPDGGGHWHHNVLVPAGGTDNVRPVVARNSKRGCASLWWLRGTYGSYTAYGTAIDYVR